MEEISHAGMVVGGEVVVDEGEVVVGITPEDGFVFPVEVLKKVSIYEKGRSKTYGELSGVVVKGEEVTGAVVMGVTGAGLSPERQTNKMNQRERCEKQRDLLPRITCQPGF